MLFTHAQKPPLHHLLTLNILMCANCDLALQLHDRFHDDLTRSNLLSVVDTASDLFIVDDHDESINIHNTEKVSPQTFIVVVFIT